MENETVEKCGEGAILLFFVFSCNIIKVNHFLHCVIIFPYLLFSSLHIMSLLVPYAYVSPESIDYIHL